MSRLWYIPIYMHLVKCTPYLAKRVSNEFKNSTFYLYLSEMTLAAICGRPAPTAAGCQTRTASSPTTTPPHHNDNNNNNNNDNSNNNSHNNPV